MIKHIIFDFGGVILQIGSDAGLGKKTTGIPDDLATIFNIPLEKATNIWKEHRDVLITGKETPREFIQRINQLLHTNYDIDQSQAAWEKRYKLEREHINWDLVVLIEQLKKMYKIHMLTDAINLNRGATDWIHEIEDHFTGIYRSYEQNRKKPDKEAYLNVLRNIDAKPEECVFIDDVEQNVVAAQQLGINSLLFTSNEQLKHDLKALQVL